jgi:hypothetical protein
MALDTTADSQFLVTDCDGGTEDLGLADLLHERGPS